MKRFWKDVGVECAGDGWSIRLDDRPVLTPARRNIVVPSREFAEGIAAEWRTQETVVSPLSMPLTRAAATCLDRVAPEFDTIAGNTAAYGGADLLCYRAPHPDGLRQRQNDAWNPMLEWAADALGVRLHVGAGIMHIAQSQETLDALHRLVRERTAWSLTGLTELVTLSGSLILALAVDHGRLTAAEAWHSSRVDEIWNVEAWGEDADEAALVARKQADFLHASRLLELLRS